MRFSGVWRLSAAVLLLSTVASAAEYRGGTVNAEVAGRAEAVAIDSAGRILTAGSDYNLGANGYALTRHYSDGAPDYSFGNSGLVVSDFSRQGMGAHASALAIDKSGRILVAGVSYPIGVPVQTYFHSTRFFLARYNSDGTFDADFGAGGFVTTDLSGAGDWATSLVIDDQGRIVVGGLAAGAPGSSPALVRYNADGSLDSAFGAGGIVTAPNCGSGGRNDALAIDSLGRIVTGGSCNGAFMLARFNPGGALDTTFGAYGAGSTTVAGIGGGGEAQWAPPWPSMASDG